MSKPLWKFLEDGGMSACIEYGHIHSILFNANCCSWATGDLLHYEFIGPSIVGENNSYTNIKETTEGCLSFDFMNKYFTRNMINNGLCFLGLGENIPKTDDDHYIIAVFHHDNQTSNAPDYHFIRQHKDKNWSNRRLQGKFVTQVFKNSSPTGIYDFLDILDSYTIFKDWFAVPNSGIQNGLDSAIFQIKNKIKISDFADNQNFGKNISYLIKFYKKKNEIINNVESLEKLEAEYSSLVYNVPKVTDKKLFINLLAKYNKNNFSMIKYSPSRNLKIGR